MAKYPGSFIINEVGTRKELASIYGVSERTIYRWLNKAAKESGLSPKVGKKTHPRDTTLANFKGTRKQLARKYGVSERTAYRWLEKAKARGTEIPSRRSESKYPGQTILSVSGTNKDIADVYGVSPSTVSKWKSKARRERAAELHQGEPIPPETQQEEDIGEPWEVPEPEDIGEPWEVPEPDQDDIGEPWEVTDNPIVDDEWTTANLAQIADLLSWGDDPILGSDSLYYDIPEDMRLAYINAYLNYQYGADEHQFYDEQAHVMIYDPDDPSITKPHGIANLDIWGDDFNEWLSWQKEAESIQL